MHSVLIASLAGVAFAQRGGPFGGRWWGGAPECAHNCLSSVYSDYATATTWPGPERFCGDDVAGPLSTCLTGSCGEMPDKWTTFSDMRQSVCSVYSSCTDNADQVYTLTRPTDGPYYNGDGSGRHPHRGGYWRSYTTGDGVITVTGCPTGGFGHGGYYGGPGRHRGWMPWGADRQGDAWWGWGYGWSDLTTYTTTVTGDKADATGTDAVIQTVVQAVSDGITATSPLGADEAINTGDADPDRNGNAANGNEVKIVGVALAAVIGVAAAL